jgi:hypothetical protein
MVMPADAPMLALNLALIFKERLEDDMVMPSFSVFCLGLFTMAHLSQVLISLLVSLFLLGRKSTAVMEIVALWKRKKELLHLMHLLQQELDQEVAAINKWMQDAPANQPSTADDEADSRLRIVGVRVCHPERGIGTITAFRKDAEAEAKGKPVVVIFDDGDQHTYSWASTLKKLKVTGEKADAHPMPEPLATINAIAKPTPEPLAEQASQPFAQTAQTNEAMCLEQQRPSEDRRKRCMPAPKHSSESPTFRTWLEASAVHSNDAADAVAGPAPRLQVRKPRYSTASSHVSPVFSNLDRGGHHELVFDQWKKHLDIALSVKEMHNAGAGEMPGYRPVRRIQPPLPPPPAPEDSRCSREDSRPSSVRIL